MRWPWAWRRTPLELPATPPEVGGADPPCLVHLVREVNGLGSFRAFAEALRAHPPGVDCELVLAMKGFASRAQAAPYLEEAGELAPKVLFFPDRGFDLGVYLALAARLRRDRYCFVNSHARPLVDGWLEKLNTALMRPGVGQVGATGSWASMHSWVMSLLGLPSAYRGLFPARPVLRELAIGIQDEVASVWGGAPSNGRRSASAAMRVRLGSVPRVPRELVDFDPFPAPHLRTNAFMVRHAALRELCLPVVCTKMDTHVLESGREGFTAQLERVGLCSLVVDRAGAVYSGEQWDRSRTFWQGDQEGLLVADNQTLCYTAGTFARRSLLSTLAWGVCADPHLPREGEPTDLAPPAAVGADVR